MKIFTIKWYNGYIELIPDLFFPCTTEKAKKIFKLIDQWCTAATISELDQYLNEEREKAFVQMQSEAKAYCDVKQKVSDLQRMIAEEKHPNGVRLTTMEMVRFKDDLKTAKRTMRNLRDSAKSLKTKVERFDRNIKLLHLQIDKRK